MKTAVALNTVPLCNQQHLFGVVQTAKNTVPKSLNPMVDTVESTLTASKRVCVQLGSARLSFPHFCNFKTIFL
jgi:hypothetical protein